VKAHKRFAPGDEIWLNTVVARGAAQCRAIVREPLHPWASGYHVETIEASALPIGHRIWVSVTDVEPLKENPQNKTTISASAHRPIDPPHDRAFDCPWGHAQLSRVSCG